jgi:quercetin dioxygenase-like cupin family protein
MLNSDSDLIAKGNSDMFPLKHTFAEGIYVREMFIQEDGLIIGRVHKNDHIWFLLTGELEIVTDNGPELYIGPCYIKAPAGTKRVLHAITDSIFINVYPNPTNNTNIEELEDNLTCIYYSTYEKYKLLNK